MLPLVSVPSASSLEWMSTRPEILKLQQNFALQVCCFYLFSLDKSICLSFIRKDCAYWLLKSGFVENLLIAPWELLLYLAECLLWLSTLLASTYDSRWDDWIEYQSYALVQLAYQIRIIYFAPWLLAFGWLFITSSICNLDSCSCEWKLIMIYFKKHSFPLRGLVFFGGRRDELGDC